MRRSVGAACLSAAMCAVAAWAAAAPADEHQRGVAAYQRGDVVGAMAALRPAAQAGHAPSQVLLAFILDRGDFPEEAARWYRLAAEQGDAEGHAGLANLLLTGRGIAKDEKAAREHLAAAIAAGHVGARQMLDQLDRPAARPAAASGARTGTAR